MIQPIEKRTARAAVSPAVDALVGSLTGVTELGREYEAGGFVGAAKELVEATPIYQAARRAGVVDEPKGEIPLHQQRVFQGSSVGEVVGPFMLGGLYPRQSRLDVARERRRQENLQGMTPARRAVAKIDYEIDEMREQLVGSGLYDQESFNAEVAEPVRLWKMREARYAREAEEQGIPVNRLSSLDRTKLDLRMLVQLGYYDAESLELELANLDLLTETELKSYRRSLGDDYFGASTISALRTAIRELTGA
jgi:hypothetical protein